MRRAWMIALALVFSVGCSTDEAAPAVTAEPAIEDASEPEPEPRAEPQTDPEAAVRATVVLVPLKSFPDDLLDAVEARLRDELAVEVVRHEAIPLPAAAYYEPRKRYRAEILLDHLDALELAIPGGVDGPVKVLGLTEVDISTTKGDIPDWGIFGLGNTPGRACVVSSKRLKRKPKNRDHVRKRVSVTAVHEVGHTFGLPHCEEHARVCVMLDAQGGIENTDATTGALGPLCRARLERLAPLGG